MSQKVAVPGDGIVLWRDGGGGAEVGENAYRGNKQLERFLQVAEITEVGVDSFRNSSLEVFEFAARIGSIDLKPVPSSVSRRKDFPERGLSPDILTPSRQQRCG